MKAYKHNLWIAGQIFALTFITSNTTKGMYMPEKYTKTITTAYDDDDSRTKEESLSTLSSSGSFTYDDDELTQDESLTSISSKSSTQTPPPYQLLHKVEAFGDAEEKTLHFPHSQNTYYSTLVKPSMITISKTGRYAAYTASEYENYTYLLDLSTMKKHPLPDLPNHESKWNSFEDLWFGNDETILHARLANGAEYQWNTKNKQLLGVNPTIKRLLVTQKNTVPEFFITPYAKDDAHKFKKHYYYLRNSNAKIAAEFYSTGKTCKILYSPACKKIITLSSYGDDHKLRIINLKGFVEYQTELNSDSTNFNLCCDGRYLIFSPSAAENPSDHLHLRDLSTGATHALNIKISGWPQPSFKSHNNLLFLWPYFRNIAVFTLNNETASAAGELDEHDCHISDIAVSNNGYLVATAGSANKIILYKKTKLASPEKECEDKLTKSAPRATQTTSKDISKPTLSEKVTPVQEQKAKPTLIDARMPSAKTIPVPPEIMKNIKGLMKAIDQRY